jgi:hypothetical protein
MLAKNKNFLSIAVRITNEAGSRGDARILMFGPTSAFDDVGNRYEQRNITGVAYCPGPDTNPPSFRLCVGVLGRLHKAALGRLFLNRGVCKRVGPLALIVGYRLL